MAHALAPHFRQRDFHTAFFADNAFEFHAFVFAAQAFIILDWTKNTRAEKTVTFGLEGPVVDGLRLFDFAK